MDITNDDNMMIYHESKMTIHSKYFVLCVGVTDSTTTPTTFTTPTASTVSTVTTSPSSFRTGSLVKILKSSSSMRHHELCYISPFQVALYNLHTTQATVWYKVDITGIDNMTIYQ